MTVDLPVADVTVYWALLAFLGVILGFISGALGIGAGIITVPVLFGIYGIRYEVAVGTSLALIIGNAGLGVLGHARRGNVNPRLGLPLGIGLAGGVLAGGWVLHRIAALSSMMFLGREKPVAQVVGAIMFSILLVYVGVITLRKVTHAVRGMKGGAADAQEAGSHKPPAWLTRSGLPPRIDLPEYGLSGITVWPLMGVGLLAGLGAGMMGVGGGFLMVPVLLYWFRVRTLVAMGTSLTGVLVAASCGTVQKILLGEVDYVLACILLLGGAVGIPLGVRISGIVAPHRLRFSYGVFCFCGAAIALAKLML